MALFEPTEKVGVFIDGQNFKGKLHYAFPNSETDFRKLYAYLKDLGGILKFVNYYAIDFSGIGELTETTPERWKGFVRHLRDCRYSPCIKPAYVIDTNAGKKIKGNQDIEIATDVLSSLAEQVIHRVVLITGDRDFAYLAERIREWPFCAQAALICPRDTAPALRDVVKYVISLEEVAPNFLKPRRPR